MKKVITVILCVLALSLIPLGASASAFDLSDYGQKTVTLSDAFTPLVDGYIDEGEYEITVECRLEENATNDEFYIYGDPTLVSDAEHVYFYMTADDDNVYFAAEQKDPRRTGHIDALYLQVGTSSTSSYIQIYLPYNAPYEVLTESDRGAWSSYVSSYATSTKGDIAIYEIAMPRSILLEKFGVSELDKLLVSMAQRVYYVADEGTVIVTWGFENAALAGTHGTQGFPVFGYPHVLELYEKAEDKDAELPDVPKIVAPETAETESIPETAEPETAEPETETETETESSEKGCGAALASATMALFSIGAIGAVCATKKRK